MTSSPDARLSSSRTGAATGGTGTGRVLTREGWPVAGASVTLLSAEGRQVARAVSASDGSLTLTDVPPGPATLLVAAPGHDPKASTVVVPPGSWPLGDLRLVRHGASPTPAPGIWVIDAAHSSVTATAHHLGLSAVHGRFTSFAGAITVPDDVSRSHVEVDIDATSIDTGNRQRDDHLRAADFLDVEQHPRLRFASTGLTRGDGGVWLLDGDLTLLGTTRPVQLRMAYNGSGPDPWGGTRAAFSATAELHRDDFKMNWNQAIGVGVTVFGTTLKVAIDIEALLQPT
ncbi:YceI family protein [Kineococcus rubinsiae]|uniref:YceI family protein n=1 Tax=Kineococcus rubinsiae TaxID=2609562 RepID=UPI0014318A57|nr:YceI family protein [Kineococcus rubinsiae]NIZ92858.1 hypothetical protein [Kineococcus rubinsiae]